MGAAINASWRSAECLADAEMLILAFDTATAATTVAVADVVSAVDMELDAAVAQRLGLVVELRDDPQPGGRPAHARRLLSLVREVLDTAALSWKQIDRIAVGVGPGTFTGMRIGIATAQALAQATGIPLVGISTLRSLELGAWAASPASVLAVIDARRGEVFAAGAGVEPRVLSPEALAELVRGRTSDRLVTVGDGAIAFREALAGAGAEVPPDSSPLHRVNAIHHCRLALEATPVHFATVEPQYLRAPDAVIAARR